MKRALTIALATVFAIAVLIAAIVFLRRKPEPPTIQGEIEVAEVDVSSKIPGRIVKLNVREGSTVRAGDVLAEMSSPEIEAKLRDAQSARAAAVAQRDKAMNGARTEEIEAARNNWLRARSAAELAQKTFERMQRLHRDGVIPTQRRDEAEANATISRDGAAAAKAMYDLAVAGARREDKDAASALVGRAEAAISEVTAYLGETKLVSPMDGEVARANIDQGEMISAGFPVVSILDPRDVWATFNVREEELNGLGIGSQFDVRVPALGATVPMRVDYVAAQADFATWRATKASGGFDVKTFEIHARPLRAVSGLRPGMSVLMVQK